MLPRVRCCLVSDAASCPVLSHHAHARVPASCAGKAAAAASRVPASCGGAARCKARVGHGASGSRRGRSRRLRSPGAAGAALTRVPGPVRRGALSALQGPHRRRDKPKSRAGADKPKSRAGADKPLLLKLLLQSRAGPGISRRVRRLGPGAGWAGAARGLTGGAAGAQVRPAARRGVSQRLVPHAGTSPPRTSPQALGCTSPLGTSPPRMSPHARPPHVPHPARPEAVRSAMRCKVAVLCVYRHRRPRRPNPRSSLVVAYRHRRP